MALLAVFALLLFVDWALFCLVPTLPRLPIHRYPLPGSGFYFFFHRS